MNQKRRAPLSGFATGTATVLDSRVLADLASVAAGLGPYLCRLERKCAARFRRASVRDRYAQQRVKAIVEVSPAAALRLLSEKRPIGDYFEQVAYNARRLAKLNVPAAEVVAMYRASSRDIDEVLSARYGWLTPVFKGVSGQLSICAALTVNNAYYQVRETETQAFYRLFHAELGSRKLPILLERFVAILRSAVRAQAGRLFLLDPGYCMYPRSVLRRLSWPRYLEGPSAESLILGEGMRRQGSYWSIPLFREKQMAGLLQLGFTTPYRWLPRELELLEAVGERCLLAAEKARLLEELSQREVQIRKLGAHVLQVEEAERRRISRELHDDAGQSMLTLRLKLEQLARSAPGELRPQLQESLGIVQASIGEIRRLIAALSPAVLEQLGLPAAVRQLAGRMQQVYPAGRIGLRIDAGPDRLPRDIETVAYRLAQECLQNAVKHSGAADINLRLRSTDRILELAVRDNGVGFESDMPASSNSFGLAGMRERVALLGGDIQIAAKPGRGTAITVQLPIPAKPPRKPVLEDRAHG